MKMKWIVFLSSFVFFACSEQRKAKIDCVKANDSTNIVRGSLDVEDSLKEYVEDTIFNAAMEPEYIRVTHRQFNDVMGKRKCVFERKTYFSYKQGKAAMFEINGRQFKVGDTVALFNNFNFAEGGWKFILHAYLAEGQFSNSSDSLKSFSYRQHMNESTYGLFDINLHTEYAILDNIGELENAKRNIKVVLTDKDLATAALKLYLVKDESIVFETYLMASDRYEGLQGPFGWSSIAEPNSLRAFLKKFKSAKKEDVTRCLN